MKITISHRVWTEAISIASDSQPQIKFALLFYSSKVCPSLRIRTSSPSNRQCTQFGTQQRRVA